MFLDQPETNIEQHFRINLMDKRSFTFVRTFQRSIISQYQA